MHTSNTPALRSFRLTTDQFGDIGPWQANSPETLADEVADTFRMFADQHVRELEMDSPEALEDTETMRGQSWREHFALEYRDQFLASLEEVRRYTIVSGEGTGEGTIETATLTESELIDRLERERCGGDRWAFARDEDGDRLEF